MLDVLCVGHAAYDIGMAVQQHPAADEKLQATGLQLGGGGPAANAAVCVARLGGRAGFCGYLGHDLFGDAHLRELIGTSVDTTYLVRGQHPTPLSQILAKADGTRSVVNYKADTPWLAEDAVHINQAIGALLFDGHEPLLSGRLCRMAREQSLPTVLDAGSLHRGTQELMGQVDYLVASETFARQYSDTDDMQRALLVLARQARCVVITQGEQGLRWQRDASSGQLDAYPVDVVDSTGAGDAFHAAFAYGLTQQFSWHRLLCYASAAGALACTQLGARAAMPAAQQLESMWEPLLQSQ